MKRLVLFGVGDAARLAHHYFREDSDLEVVAFTVDEAYRRDTSFRGLPLVAFEEVDELYPPDGHEMFISVGYRDMNRFRAAKVEAAKRLGYRLPSYVSSRCSYLSEHAAGANCFILEDNTIQPFVRIGDNVTLWSGNHVGHDSVIEDHCFVTSHVVISGNCRIGAYSFLGVNSSLHDGLSVAPRSLIGAGAVITADTSEGSVHVPPRSLLLDKKSDQIDL